MLSFGDALAEEREAVGHESTLRRMFATRLVLRLTRRLVEHSWRRRAHMRPQPPRSERRRRRAHLLCLCISAARYCLSKRMSHACAGDAHAQVTRMRLKRAVVSSDGTDDVTSLFAILLHLVISVLHAVLLAVTQYIAYTSACAAC